MIEFLEQLLWLLAFLLDIAMFLTCPIYILLLITLWKYRKEETLKHSFFKLMFSIGIADIGMISTIFFSRVAQWGWFPLFFIRLGNLSARIFNFFNIFFGTAQAVGVFVVAVNRYTAYMIPFRHQKIWRGGKVVIAAIVAQWIISFLSVIPAISIIQFNIYVGTDNRSVYFQFTDPCQALYFGIPLTMVGKTSLVVMIFILYGIVFITARKNHRLGRMTTVEKTMLKMSAVGFFHSVGLAIYLANLIAGEVSWFGFQHNLWDYNQDRFLFNLGQNLYSAVNPYALLFFSTPVRRNFFKLYHLPLHLTFSTSLNHVAPVQEVTPSVMDNENQNGQIEL